MMHDKEIEIKKDNGSTLYIRVRLNDDYQWRIANVGVKGYRKRTVIYLLDSLRNNYSYRALNFEERQKAELRKYLEVCSADDLNFAIQEAWESIRPTLFTTEDFE